MKITKTSKDAQIEKLSRKDALAGCDVCPCCGESKDLWYYINNFGEIEKGIVEVGQRRSARGNFFNMKVFAVDRFKCLTCGAEWESEEYLVS